MINRIKQVLAIVMTAVIWIWYLFFSFTPLTMADPNYTPPRFDTPKIEPPKPIKPPKPIDPPKPVDPPNVDHNGKVGSGGSPSNGEMSGKGQTNEAPSPEQSFFDRLFDPENPVTGTDTYKILKYEINVYIFGIAKFLESPANDIVGKSTNPLHIPGSGKTGGDLYFLLASITRGYLALDVESGSFFQKALDIWGLVDQGAGFFKMDLAKASAYINTLKYAPEGFNEISAFQKARLVGLKAFSNVDELEGFVSWKGVSAPATALGKVAGVVGLAFSVAEVVYNSILLTQAEDYSKEQADALLGIISGLGGILSGAAIFVAAAFPPLAVGMAVAGLVIAIIATVAKYFTGNKAFTKLITAPYVWYKKAPKYVVKKLFRGAKRVFDGYMKVRSYIGKKVVQVTTALYRAGKEKIKNGLKAVGSKLKGWFGG